jgi:4'-phosphopantetheinyl transferase
MTWSPQDLRTALRLAPDEVHLWLADPDDPRVVSLHPSYERTLSAEELRRNEGLSGSARRREFLTGRALMRTALSSYHPEADARWIFRTTTHGRLELDPSRGTRFNLTHCEGLVACAMTAGSPVGVDAEPHARAAKVHALASRILSDEELDASRRLADPGERQARSLGLWTLKEAYLKGMGLGLSIPLRSITFRVRGGHVALADAGLASDLWSWEFRLLHLDRHQLALATSPGSAGPLALRVWESIPLHEVRRRPDLEERRDPLPGNER